MLLNPTTNSTLPADPSARYWAIIIALREFDLGYPVELFLRYASVTFGLVTATVLTGDLVIFGLLICYLTSSLTFNHLVRSAVRPVTEGKYRQIFFSNVIASSSYGGCAVYLVFHDQIEIIVLGTTAVAAQALYYIVRHRVLSAMTIWDAMMIVLAGISFCIWAILQLEDLLPIGIVVLSAVAFTFYYLNSQFQSIHINNELSAARESAIETQKMRAVAQLTAGIARDFEDLITIIRGNVELLEICPPQHSPDVYYREAKGALDRASQLTERLQAFSKKARLRPKPIALEIFLPEFEAMTKCVLASDITLSSSHNPPPTHLYCDQNQLESALLNVLINADEAMQGKGTVILRCSPASPELLKTLELSPSASQKFASIQVHDSGPGIPNELLKQVVEPFFTTKTDSRASGLGLSMARGFAEQSGGGLYISNAKNGGALVSMILPTRPPAPPPLP